MTTTALPKLTVGLPVYNGERYLPAAIESYLGQTFGDFDLVVSDNASTDATADICHSYAARDARIRYGRNATNLGAGPNLNRVFEVARPTELFKWTAADDAYAPTYLARCVAALDADPTAVLCHSRATVIDEAGQPVPVVGGPPGHYAATPAGAADGAGGHDAGAADDGTAPAAHAPVPWADHYDHAPRLASADPVERFREVLLHDRRCFEIWGVMRRAGVLRTHLHESYYGSDKVMLTALALAGRFVEVPEALYFRRHHGGSSDSIKGTKAREAWMDTRAAARRRTGNPRLKCLAGYRRSLAEAKLPLGQRARGYAALARYLARAERWAAALRQPR